MCIRRHSARRGNATKHCSCTKSGRFQDPRISEARQMNQHTKISLGQKPRSQTPELGVRTGPLPCLEAFGHSRGCGTMIRDFEALKQGWKGSARQYSFAAAGVRNPLTAFKQGSNVRQDKTSQERIMKLQCSYRLIHPQFKAKPNDKPSNVSDCKLESS